MPVPPIRIDVVQVEAKGSEKLWYLGYIKPSGEIRLRQFHIDTALKVYWSLHRQCYHLKDKFDNAIRWQFLR